jgi:hypothetical protein
MSFYKGLYIQHLERTTLQPLQITGLGSSRFENKRCVTMSGTSTGIF